MLEHTVKLNNINKLFPIFLSDISTFSPGNYSRLVRDWLEERGDYAQSRAGLWLDGSMGGYLKMLLDSLRSNSKPQMVILGYVLGGYVLGG